MPVDPRNVARDGPRGVIKAAGRSETGGFNLLADQTAMRKDSPMRFILAALCATLLVGCAGTTPVDVGDPSVDTNTLPGDPDPVGVDPNLWFDPAAIDGPLVRRGEADLTGTVTLNGSTTTSTSYDESPFEARVGGRIGDLCLIALTPFAIPSATNNTFVQFKGATASYGSLPYPTNNTLQYMPLYLTQTEPVGVVLHNSATVGGPLFPEAARFTGSIKTIPKEDSGEPNDDENLATYTDRTLGGTLPVGSTFNRSFFRRTAGANEDREDWYKLNLLGQTTYRVTLNNSNGTWGNWTYDLRLLTSAGTVIASRLGVTGNSSTIDLTTSAVGTFYLQVSGLPTSRRGASVYYSTYSINLKTLTVPAVTSVSPGGAIGGLDQTVTFSATTVGEPISWSWNFIGGGVYPSFSNDPSPTVELIEQGTFSGKVTVSNAQGSSGEFAFVYSVGGGIANWNTYDAASGAEFAYDNSVFFQESNSDIAVAHRNATSGALHFTYTSSPQPDFDDWVTYAIPLATNADDPSLTYSNGRYWLAYYGAGTTNLKMAFTDDSSPTVTDDWNTMEFPSGDDQGRHPGIVTMGTRIGVAFENASTDKILFGRSTVDDPILLVNWLFMDAYSPQTAEAPVLAFQNNRPFIVAEQVPTGLFMIYATNATPSSSGDWTGLATESGQEIRDLSVTTLGGYPAMSYFRDSTDDLVVRYARNNSWVTGNDFITVIVDPDSMFAEGHQTSLIEVDGRLAVGYYNNVGQYANFRIGRALVADPNLASEWIRTTVDQATYTGGFCGLIKWNDHIIAMHSRAYAGSHTVRISMADREF